MDLKISYYSPTGAYLGQIHNIKNISFLQFNEKVQGGQGECNIDLDTVFHDTTHEVGQYVEYSILKDAKTSHLYTGRIESIKRYQNEKEEGMSLKIVGIVGMLSGEEKIDFYFQGKLFEVVASWCAMFNASQSLSQPLEYLGDIILKNHVQDETYVSGSGTQKTYFQHLQDVFKVAGKEFFIDRLGQVWNVEEITTTHTLTLGVNVVSFSISDKEETDLVVENIADFHAGDMVRLQNIPQGIHVQNARIKEVAVGLQTSRLKLGKVFYFSDVL